MAELARIETVVVLQTADLFSECTAHQILRISAISHQRSFREGEVIYRANDPATHLFCVVRGAVEVEDRRGAARRVGPLGTFGVEEILSGRLRAGEARAGQDCLLLAIDSEDFFDLLANNIEIVKALFRRLLRPDGPAPGQEVNP